MQNNTTYDDREMVSNTCRTRLHEVVHRAGIKIAVRPHGYTGALLMNGGDPVSQQKLLWHLDMSMQGNIFK